MSWYYAGPEAKPVGPVSLEELHARRTSGAILPETYVIEHTGQANAPLAWKRYRDLFPSNPQPAVTACHARHRDAARPSPAQLPTQPHPLFPSAAPVPTGPYPLPHDTRPDPYYATRKTNVWCGWGFGLGFAGFLFSFVCGIGLLLALPAVVLCLLGLAQLQKNREEVGRGLAMWGLALSGMALVISLILIAALAIPAIRAHGLTATEQTSNDSD